MNRRLLLLAIPMLLLAAGLAAACGGGNDSPNPTDNGATGNRPTENGPTGTAGPFETALGALVEDLSKFRVTIGDVPPDVGAHLLADCEGLETFVDRDRIEGICEAIQQAMANADPGLIDRVLAELAELTPD